MRFRTRSHPTLYGEITAFTTLLDVVESDYPWYQAIVAASQIAPWVLVGVASNSSDNSLDVVRRGTDDLPGVHVIEIPWEKGLAHGWSISCANNEVLKKIGTKWALYFQADEILTLKEPLNLTSDLPQEFNFQHYVFGGQYRTMHDRFYRQEIRLFPTDKGIYSYGDGQGFRVAGDRKMPSLRTNNVVDHYGWARHPARAARKVANAMALWYGRQPTTQEEIDAAEKACFGGEDMSFEKFLSEIKYPSDIWSIKHHHWVMKDYLEARTMDPDTWIAMFLDHFDKEKQAWLSRSSGSPSFATP